MTTGLKLPLQTNSTGGLALVNKEENNNKIIKIALSDGDNENAFQQKISLGLESIFDINDNLIRSKIILKIKNMFKKFQAEKRFVLMEDTVEWDESGGELKLTFKYLDMESDDPKTYNQSFGKG